jgi:hypothetical protein
LATPLSGRLRAFDGRLTCQNLKFYFSSPKD